MGSAMRERAALTSTELVRADPSVAVVLAEISTEMFADAARFAPGRVINLGIMEGTMIDVAAGFAMEGFNPIAHTITPFLVERPYEQMKLDFAHQGLGGTFISTGASYDYAAEGPTHQAPGDVAALLAIPGFEILVPGHAGELDRLLRATYANDAPTYIRASAASNARARDVVPGRLEVVSRSRGPTVVAVGPMLDRTLEAVRGLDVSVAYLTSVRPFDGGGLRDLVPTAGTVIVVEPFYQGTLASVIMEAMGGRAVGLASIGVPLGFPAGYGTPEDHDRQHTLDIRGLRARMESLIDRRIASR
jgi:transketolase